MSGQAFTTKKTIMVRDDEGNFITIREKIPFGGRARLKGAIIGGMTQDTAGNTDLKMDLGRYQQVLLEEGIVAWGGEAFLDEEGKLRPVSKTAIAELDSEWPLLDDVLTELGNRNQINGGIGGLSPNGSTSSNSGNSGSESSTENTQEQ